MDALLAVKFMFQVSCITHTYVLVPHTTCKAWRAGHFIGNIQWLSTVCRVQDTTNNKQYQQDQQAMSYLSLAQCIIDCNKKISGCMK